MNNLQELKPTQRITPFTRFCCTIGNIPTSYMVSLTYEEQLLWLCDYLEKTVIPTVNTNASAVAELQSLYMELKDYVDHYFDNLDVQEEINNKLDEMVENGTLLRILNQYDVALNIKLFGCIDDNETDNSENLINAFQYCYENKRTLYVPNGNFAFNSQINIQNIPNIKMDGTLIYSGNENDYSLILGNTTTEQNNLDIEFKIKSTQKSTLNKGLKLININNSNIKLKYINQFGIGVTLEGNSKGFSYNKIDCYNIYNNNIGVELVPTNNGWVNENLFLNGNFKYSNQLDKTGTIGIKIVGTTNFVNNNYFLKPSFEQLDTAVSLVQASNNTFEQCRCEKVNNSLITDDLSRVNRFNIGYGNIVYNINNNTNLLTSQAIQCLLSPVKIYNIIYNDETTFSTSNDVLYMNTNNYCIMHSGGSTSKSIGYNNNYLLSEGYLKQLVTNKAVGVFIDTSTVKKFYARKFTKFDEPGRWFVRFYDENKDVINASTIGDFKETSESMNAYNDISQGYRTLADLNHDILINVPENAKYIFLGLTRVSTAFSIKQMQIYADGTTSTSDDLAQL